MQPFTNDTTWRSIHAKALLAPFFKFSSESAETNRVPVNFAQCQLADKNCLKTMQPIDSTKFLQVDTSASRFQIAVDKNTFKEVERETMISSPCKDCPRLNSPKDECVEYCEKIRTLQSYIVAQGNSLGTASDYTELESLQAAIPTGNGGYAHSIF